MGVFSRALAAVVRKPFTILYMGFLMLVICVLWRLNPVIPMITGFSRAGNGNIFGQVISILQFTIQKDVLPYFIAGMLLLSLGGGLAISVFMSGYMNVLDNAVKAKSFNSIKEFRKGTGKLFVRLLAVSSTVMLAVSVFAFFMLVASVPLMIILRTVSIENPRFLAASVLVALLTVAVLFLGSMYFRIYTLFWFPAVVNGCQKSFRAGKHAADKHFWQIVFIFFIFDIVLVSGLFLFTYFEDSIYLFAAKWAFGTLYATLCSAYVFSAFNTYSGRQK